MKPFKVEIYSDVVCPWCYVGKRNITSALNYYQHAYPDERQPEVVWMPYMLHATIPREGLDRKEYLRRRMPGANAVESHERVARAGRKVGIEFRFDRIEVQPNTTDAHRLIRFAGRHGVEDAMAERLFQAFFIEGENVSDRGLLVKAGTDIGLDEDETTAYLASEMDTDWVVKQDARGKRRGISTVPFLVLNERKGASAVQTADQLFQALKWARKDTARPSWVPSFI